MGSDDLKIDHFEKTIVIVGGLGRGYRLHQRIKSHDGEKIDLPLGKTAQLKVEFIDLSFRFPYPSEYWQGPFPYFQAGDDTELAASSYSILTQQGPLELASESQLRLASRRYPGILTSLGKFADIVEHGSAQTLLVENNIVAEAVKWSQPVLRWNAGKNQRKTRSPVDVEDLAFSGSLVSGILAKTERSEILKLDQLVWCFSSAETAHLRPNLAARLFSGKKRDPVYSWIVFHVEFSEQPAIPPEFLWVPDPLLHWSHANGVAMRKISESAGRILYQAWVRIPEAHRFATDYLKNEEKDLSQLLSSCQIPGLKAFRILPPKELAANSMTLGPALFSSYQQGDWERNRLESVARNIHFLNFERTQGLTWSDFAALERETEEQISRWWMGEVEALKKKLKKIKTDKEV